MKIVNVYHFPLADHVAERTFCRAFLTYWDNCICMISLSECNCLVREHVSLAVGEYLLILSVSILILCQ